MQLLQLPAEPTLLRAFRSRLPPRLALGMLLRDQRRPQLQLHQQSIAESCCPAIARSLTSNSGCAQQVPLTWQLRMQLLATNFGVYWDERAGLDGASPRAK